ncbi:DJ-1/PfpI family protein [Fusobacterium simiae]|uniref:DJ-1/PfpI family protein n=1 Tax=Fusobacterium TaxID=848 RepID=UPI0018986751|nr:MULTISPECIES: DJ-1/PfpI family protein [Fusobacterium]MDC7956525.1 DJ-1/PfpI family protein [Fusobacterium simiae]
MKKICMYLLNGMADHEHGYLLAALSSQKKPKYEFCTVALTKETIVTMGGLKVTPDYTLNEINKDDIIALILVGADIQLWLNKEQETILNLADELLKRNILVAGICGATLGLASKGLLNERIHTSNIEFLLTNFVKNYNGIKNYKNDIMAIYDKKLVTASSAGALLWTKYILENLEIFSKTAIENWYEYYKSGISKYYIEFMEVIKEDKNF